MKHLTRDQHIELAQLLNQAADNLTTASRIVNRAGFTDQMLYASGTIQDRLIDPLRDAWETLGSDKCPYQSVAYGGPVAYRRQ
jgi:hypothetical protein